VSAFAWTAALAAQQQRTDWEIFSELPIRFHELRASTGLSATFLCLGGFCLADNARVNRKRIGRRLLAVKQL
jgi:hypothetical protein